MACPHPISALMHSVNSLSPCSQHVFSSLYVRREAMMDVHDSEATHSSSESGVQSLKLLDGSLGVAVSVLLVSVSFAPHASRSVKNTFIGYPLGKSLLFDLAKKNSLIARPVMKSSSKRARLSHPRVRFCIPIYSSHRDRDVRVGWSQQQ